MCHTDILITSTPTVSVGVPTEFFFPRTPEHNKNTKKKVLEQHRCTAHRQTIKDKIGFKFNVIDCIKNYTPG